MGENKIKIYKTILKNVFIPKYIFSFYKNIYYNNFYLNPYINLKDY